MQITLSNNKNPGAYKEFTENIEISMQYFFITLYGVV